MTTDTLSQADQELAAQAIKSLQEHRLDQPATEIERLLWNLLAQERELEVQLRRCTAADHALPSERHYQHEEEQRLTKELAAVRAHLEKLSAQPGTSPRRQQIDRRQDERLQRLRALGGDYEWQNTSRSWVVSGKRGAVSRLTNELQAAKEHCSDKKSVINDLMEAAARESKSLSSRAGRR